MAHVHLSGLAKEVEDRLSEALLSGQIQLGDKVTLGASKGKITLNVGTKSTKDRSERITNCIDEMQRRSGQKCLTPRNKKEFPKIVL